MYYHNSKVTTHLQCKFFQDNSDNPVATHCTNNTHLPSPTRNPKKCLYHALSFLGQLPKNNRIRVFTILRKNRKPKKNFGAMPRTPKLQKYVQYSTISCHMSSPVIETSRNSSYMSQESVITVSVMISLHTIQDVDTYKWSDTSTCQLDMYTHT